MPHNFNEGAAGATKANTTHLDADAAVSPISVTPMEKESNDLTLITTTNEARVDSRLLARQLGNKHRHVMALLDRYVVQLKTFGHVSFKNADGERRQGGGKAERFALLNEDQAYFLLSLSRNSETVVNLKANLIKTFGEYRRASDMRRTDYLPSYHRLSEAIHSVAAGSTTEKHVHANVAKLLNKTVGIESGQRANASLPKQAFMIVAQEIATRAMLASQDHRDGYERVKRSMLSFIACTMFEAK